MVWKYVHVTVLSLQKHKFIDSVLPSWIKRWQLSTKKTWQDETSSGHIHCSKTKFVFIQYITQDRKRHKPHTHKYNKTVFSLFSLAEHSIHTTLMKHQRISVAYSSFQVVWTLAPFLHRLSLYTEPVQTGFAQIDHHSKILLPLTWPHDAFFRGCMKPIFSEIKYILDWDHKLQHCPSMP